MGNSNQCVLGPATEPVHGAPADEAGKFETAISKLLTNRREAEDNMEVLSGPGDEVIVKVLLGGWCSGELFLHDRDKIASDLIQLIPCKEVGHLYSTCRTDRALG